MIVRLVRRPAGDLSRLAGELRNDRFTADPFTKLEQGRDARWLSGRAQYGNDERLVDTFQFDTREVLQRFRAPGAQRSKTALQLSRAFPCAVERSRMDVDENARTPGKPGET